MHPLDGHYRHLGASLSWDDAGVTLVHSAERVTANVTWDHIEGARQIGGRPGFVQLLVSGHVPPPDPRHDPFAVPVNSAEDANRLLVNIGWRASAVSAVGGEQKSQMSSWRRPRARRS